MGKTRQNQRRTAGCIRQPAEQSAILYYAFPNTRPENFSQNLPPDKERVIEFCSNAENEMIPDLGIPFLSFYQIAQEILRKIAARSPPRFICINAATATALSAE